MSWDEQGSMSWDEQGSMSWVEGEGCVIVAAVRQRRHWAAPQPAARLCLVLVLFYVIAL